MWICLCFTPDFYTTRTKHSAVSMNYFGYDLPIKSQLTRSITLRASLILTLMFVCFSAQAEGIIYKHSGDTLQKLYSELHYLRQAGIEIHQKFDVNNDLSQLKACQSEYGYISTRAKATIGIANRLDSPNKQEYIDTGWKAFDCIKCTGHVESCDAIPPTLETIKAEFKELKAQQH